MITKVSLKLPRSIIPSRCLLLANELSALTWCLKCITCYVASGLIKIERCPRPYVDKDGKTRYTTNEFESGTRDPEIRKIVNDMMKGL